MAVVAKCVDASPCRMQGGYSPMSARIIRGLHRAHGSCGTRWYAVDSASDLPMTTSTRLMSMLPPAHLARRHWIVAAAAMAVAACSKQGEPAAASAPPAITVEAIESRAKGFVVGQAMLAHVIYVFFDPQCPHCAALWSEVKPLVAKVRFVWIPVRLLGDKSLTQGAAILGAPDPLAAMEQNETSVRANQGGISATDAPQASKDAVTKNTELFTQFAFSGVPTLVGKNARTGEVVVVDGALPAAQVAERFGL